MKGELLWKYWFFRMTLALSFASLTAAVFRLSVIKHEYFRMRARDNKICSSVIPAARGTIYDKKGRVVAESLYQYFRISDDGNKLYEGVGTFEGFKFI